MQICPSQTIDRTVPYPYVCILPTGRSFLIVLDLRRYVRAAILYSIQHSHSRSAGWSLSYYSSLSY